MSIEKYKNCEEILNRVKLSLNIASNKELAERLGVSANTISTWKKRKTLDLGKILLICDSPKHWILTGQNEPEGHKDVLGNQGLAENKEDLNGESEENAKISKKGYGNQRRSGVILDNRSDTLTGKVYDSSIDFNSEGADMYKEIIELQREMIQFLKEENARLKDSLKGELGKQSNQGKA